MNLINLIARSLRYYWRTHLGVIGAAAVATAVLTGALLVGDSVSGTLHQTARLRLGSTSVAMSSGNNFFQTRLGDDLAGNLNAPVATVIQLAGVAARGDNQPDRTGNVNVMGVTEAFWKLAPSPPSAKAELKGGQVAINEPLAARLGVKPGEQILLTISKPSLLSRDAPLSRASDSTKTLRLDVVAVVSTEQFGRFSLHANQAAPLNAFLPLEWLTEKLELSGRANLLLIGNDIASERANKALGQTWTLADAGLEVKSRRPESTELRSKRIFLQPSVVEAVKKLSPKITSEGIFTYFVNELSVSDRTTPYSTVTARGPLTGGAQSPGDNEVIISKWLSDDLSTARGDTLKLKYYVLAPMRKLIERTAEFKIAKVIDNDSELLDPDLMPDYPGLSEADDCRDWDPGIKIQQRRINDEDREYWKKYRGTPKAIISLAAGRKLWSNRFGNLTAIRIDQPASTVAPAIREKLVPAEVGLVFTDVSARAQAAATEALDFGQLFLSLSMFLVAAAVLLAAMVFALGVRQRTGELGVLLAAGFTQKRVRRLVLGEGSVLIILAMAIGLPGGILYTRVVLGGLDTIWTGAVARTDIDFHASGTTIAIGAVSSFVVALGAILIVLRRQFRRAVRGLLDNIPPTPPLKPPRSLLRAPSFLTAVVSLAAGVVSLLVIDSQTAGFFGAGFFLLIALLSLCRTWLSRVAGRRSGAGVSLMDIARRGS
ncbi:MAG: FtsX-like permease family protein, partial [bacterium]|nr:FtsX-like permease family protein [bacterium]